MKFKVSWYRETGKWYVDDEVDVGDVRYCFEGDFKQAIVDSQEALTDGWQDHGFYIVTNAREEDLNNPLIHGFFYERLFFPNSFAGMKRNVGKE